MLELSAPAKINLGLSVLAKRGDGFHEIDTIMAKLGLTDRVVLEATDTGIEGVATPSGDLFVDRQAPPMDADNLALRAASAYLAAAGHPGGVRVQLEKRIPVSAGLGGGSSNAAAVLLGLSRLYPADLDLFSLAQKIGSDVPFFVLDGSGARARGRGERLEPLEVPECTVVLANPGAPVSAGEAYERLKTFTPRLRVATILEDLASSCTPRYVNALQPGVSRAYPEVRATVIALRGAGLEGVIMSGSGATCFGLLPASGSADEVVDRLRSNHPDWWIVATTLGSSGLGPSLDRSWSRS